MPQFLIPAGKKIGDAVALTAEEAHHLSAVLRKQSGDEIRLTDGAGSLFRGKIDSLAKKGGTVTILEKLETKEPVGRILFAQALLKGDKMEFVLQKAAELGVHTFLPFTSSRTVVEWKKGADKIERWRKIAQASSKQCGRSLHMNVEEPCALKDLVRRIEAEVKIAFWEESKSTLRDFFAARVRRIAPAGSVITLIGPEGGFSKEEADLFLQHGFTALSLGSLVLRAETAAVTAISLIQYELGNI